MFNFHWILIIFAGLNSTIGNLLFKKALSNGNFIDNLVSVYFITGCAFHGINVLMFAYALKYIDVSKAYPVLASVSFVTLMILSSYFLSEKITFDKITGILVVLVGIFILSK